jgi:5'-3' exonuclease
MTDFLDGFHWNAPTVKKEKYWIIDYSFYIYNGTYAYRRRCTCWDDKLRIVKPGKEECPKCRNERWLFMSSQDGHVTGGLYGFLKQAIEKIKEGYKIITVFDPPKEQLTRMLLLDTYKGNRAPVPEYVTYQMDWGIKIFPHTDGIECYYSHHDESDDVMATIAIQKAEAGYEVVVASDDKDMFPLLGYENIRIYRQKELFDADTFRKYIKKKHEIDIEDPARFNEFLAICGDSADNFNIIKGLGPKAAEYIIKNYDNVMDVFDDLDNLPSKYKKKLEYFLCDGTVCPDCVKCHMFEKLQDRKQEMDLSLKIATLECDATYHQLKGVSDRQYVLSMLESLDLKQAKENIDLFFGGASEA